METKNLNVEQIRGIVGGAAGGRPENPSMHTLHTESRNIHKAGGLVKKEIRQKKAIRRLKKQIRKEQKGL